MRQSDLDHLKTTIRSAWDEAPGAKAKPYVGKFFERTRTGRKIVAKVEGNHGTYTVSIQAKQKEVDSACSCYIGGDGFCHHCAALANTFLKDPGSFKVVKRATLKQVRNPDELKRYLKGKTLASLLKDLKERGISQKDFAQGIGIKNPHAERGGFNPSKRSRVLGVGSTARSKP